MPHYYLPLPSLLRGKETAFAAAMGTINNLFTYLQSELSGALQNATPLTNTQSGTTTQAASSAGVQSDNQQLSPLAQVLNELQQLQQTNPTEYSQITQQIATKIQSASATAQSEGNTTEANLLSQVATDFSNASQSGQLPNFQNLAQAAGGHHHHHHGNGGQSSSDGSTTSNSTDAWLSGSNSVDALSGLGSQANGSTQTASTDPFQIILQTLSSAGITNSAS